MKPWCFPSTFCLVLTLTPTSLHTCKSPKPWKRWKFSVSESGDSEEHDDEDGDDRINVVSKDEDDDLNGFDVKRC